MHDRLDRFHRIEDPIVSPWPRSMRLDDGGIEGLRVRTPHAAVAGMRPLSRAIPVCWPLLRLFALAAIRRRAASEDESVRPARRQKSA